MLNDILPNLQGDYVVIVPSSETEFFEINGKIGHLDNDFRKKDVFQDSILRLKAKYYLHNLGWKESLAPEENGFVLTKGKKQYSVQAPACAIFTLDVSRDAKRSDLFDKYPVEKRAIAAYNSTPAYYIPYKVGLMVIGRSVSEACNIALGLCAEYLEVI